VRAKGEAREGKLQDAVSTSCDEKCSHLRKISKEVTWSCPGGTMNLNQNMTGHT
jgi:hypothetical protein